MTVWRGIFKNVRNHDAYESASLFLRDDWLVLRCLVNSAAPRRTFVLMNVWGTADAWSFIKLL